LNELSTLSTLSELSKLSKLSKLSAGQVEYVETSREAGTSGRAIAIGDIHGCAAALDALLERISPEPTDMLITLGDYVDRGPDSRGVLDRLVGLVGSCRLVPILGNHDEMMLHARRSEQDYLLWRRCGGVSAIRSYSEYDDLEAIPEAHFAFLGGCLDYFETDTHVFMHANYAAHLPFSQLNSRFLRWLTLNDYLPGPHFSGKVAVVGHTPQKEVYDAGHLLCLDTGCGFGGLLTAYDVQSGQCWQVDESGKPKGG
jgi:serine/threonine protein phosphatase 1